MVDDKDTPLYQDNIDVFISYTRSDKESAEALCKFLKNQGLDVWWDYDVNPGDIFRQEIQHALDTARCVVVLWSSTSIQRDWVLDEAEVAKQRGILVPALIEEVKIPLGFGQRQAANLSGWKGEFDHPELSKLLKQITFLTYDSSQAKNKGIIPDETQADTGISDNSIFVRQLPSSHLNWVRKVVAGFMGGAIGGIAGGLLVGLNYYSKFHESDLRVSTNTVLEVVLFTCIFGAVIGGSIMFSIYRLRQLAKGKSGFLWGLIRIIGGPLGGIFSGAVLGIMAGVFFGFRYEYYPGDVLLLGGATIGAAILTLGAVYFEPGRVWPKIAWSVASTLIVTALLVGVGVGVFAVLQPELQKLFADGWKMTEAQMTQAGATVGGIIGLIIGSQVQWALYLITADNISSK